MFVKSDLLKESHITAETPQTPLCEPFWLQFLALADVTVQIFGVDSTGCTLFGLNQHVHIKIVLDKRIG